MNTSIFYLKISRLNNSMLCRNFQFSIIRNFFLLSLLISICIFPLWWFLRGFKSMLICSTKIQTCYMSEYIFLKSTKMGPAMNLEGCDVGQQPWTGFGLLWPLGQVYDLVDKSFVLLLSLISSFIHYTTLTTTFFTLYFCTYFVVFLQKVSWHMYCVFTCSFPWSIFYSQLSQDYSFFKNKILTIISIVQNQFFAKKLMSKFLYINTKRK